MQPRALKRRIAARRQRERAAKKRKLSAPHSEDREQTIRNEILELMEKRDAIDRKIRIKQKERHLWTKSRINNYKNKMVKNVNPNLESYSSKFKRAKLDVEKEIENVWNTHKMQIAMKTLGDEYEMALIENERLKIKLEERKAEEESILGRKRQLDDKMWIAFHDINRMIAELPVKTLRSDDLSEGAAENEISEEKVTFLRTLRTNLMGSIAFIREAHFDKKKRALEALKIENDGLEKDLENKGDVEAIEEGIENRENFLRSCDQMVEYLRNKSDDQ